tara:strand:+ start:74 stop:475 length:402 start_codon:yes stop_codon:yes gene_type:complete
MNYQGEQVNFSQVSNDQLLSALQATNRQVATNSDNLVKMGKDMTVMGENDTYFGDSITRLDSVVNDLTRVWQKTVGNINTNTNAIKTNSENLVQIGIDHKNMGKGGGVNLFGLSTAALAAGGLGAYLLLKGKK